MKYNLKDQVVFITGAANGIGERVVRLLLAENVKHVTITDIDQTKGLNLENELNSKYGGSKVKFIKCDSTHDQELSAAFKWTTDKLGYIDMVINNAGFMNDNPHKYKKEIELNVTALVTGTLKAIELMRKDDGGKGGAVINISSVAGITQNSVMPIYNATKSAVLQFSNCIGHIENYARTGVRVTICLGATKTSLLDNITAFDKRIDQENLYDVIGTYPVQSVDSAAKGVIEASRNGDTGSTWLVNADQIKDITPAVRKAFGLLEDVVFNP